MDYYSVVPGAGLSALRRGASITSISNLPSAPPGAGALPRRAGGRGAARADILTDKGASRYYRCHRRALSMHGYGWEAAVDETREGGVW